MKCSLVNSFCVLFNFFDFVASDDLKQKLLQDINFRSHYELQICVKYRLLHEY